MLRPTWPLEFARPSGCRDVAELSSVLAAEESACDAQATMAWIDQYSGPLPAEQMPERVAKVVLDLIHHTNGSNKNCN